MNDYLDTSIFSNSKYQASQKAFRKWSQSVMPVPSKFLKGAGLHSIRSDYSTRYLNLLERHFQDRIVALKVIAHLLGHSGGTNMVLNHYVNMGGFETERNDENDESEEDEWEELDITPIEYLNNSTDRGSTAINALRIQRKCPSNLNNIINVVDTNYIVPKRKKKDNLNKLVYV